MLIFYYKLEKNLLPTNLSNMFSKYSLANHNTRLSNVKLLCEPTRNTKAAELTLSYSLPRSMNNLSMEYGSLLNEKNLDNFKLKLKKKLIDQYQSTTCQIVNCYPCSQRLFFGRYLPIFIQYLSVFSYYNQY